MRSLYLALASAAIAVSLQTPSVAQDVLDFDRDCLSSPIGTAEVLGSCGLMIVEIAELENASPSVVDERISRAAANANAGGGVDMMKNACGLVPLASYRGGAGNEGKVYQAFCTGI